MVRIVCSLLISRSMAGIQFMSGPGPGSPGFSYFWLKVRSRWCDWAQDNTLSDIITISSSDKIGREINDFIAVLAENLSWWPDLCICKDAWWVVASTACVVCLVAPGVRVIMSLICRNLTRITNVPDHNNVHGVWDGRLIPHWLSEHSYALWLAASNPTKSQEERTHSFASQAETSVCYLHAWAQAPQHVFQHRVLVLFASMNIRTDQILNPRVVPSCFSAILGIS